jgi:hypothetical protein
MTFPSHIKNADKTGVAPSSAPKPRPCEPVAGVGDSEEAAFCQEQRGWIVPAIVCLLLTAGSFYYCHQKVAQESRTELKVIRADASLRRAHLASLQAQARFQQQQLWRLHTLRTALFRRWKNKSSPAPLRSIKSFFIVVSPAIRPSAAPRPT